MEAVARSAPLGEPTVTTPLTVGSLHDGWFLVAAAFVGHYPLKQLAVDRGAFFTGFGAVNVS